MKQFLITISEDGKGRVNAQCDFNYESNNVTEKESLLASILQPVIETGFAGILPAHLRGIGRSNDMNKAIRLANLEADILASGSNPVDIK